MQKTIIIAEAGVNHNGDLNKAFQLVDAAADAQVDYVKFQLFDSKKLVSKFAKKANYQNRNTGNNIESQLEMLQRLELSHSDFSKLRNYCDKKDIQFFATAFDLDSLCYLKEIGLNLVKIPSGEITNLPYLRLAAQLFKKVILSTGMADMGEIGEAVDVFLKNGVEKNDITILHCNTEYPTPMIDVNLKAMLSIQAEMQTPIGYSDHTMGIEVPIAAVALGAVVIEKHFTLDRNLPGPDHKASLEPNELKTMVASIRNIEKAISGNGAKVPSYSEARNKDVARKSIVAKYLIREGEIFSENNVTIKRPGTGLSPMKWDSVLGKKAKRNFEEDELIEL
ncbi:N-acetylneuraminate synthase [Arachidicoccus rhizosphaerae]|uniref:N-acetylneuraminate synthase n=1 Tax=Arachidicoccus rhizosphaerae TaxID=551991 RepID=A0A1H4CP83_9BACT|nr:N-acetylneuraminate synthase [Arachidicoccus rhizosphaerae]SEA62225.1 N-acetylneuraminate synthase [Arachidicoccus rhizosphaerae]